MKVIVFIILVLYAAVIIPRNTEWKSSQNFFESILVYNPSYRVINNLGNVYAEKGNYEKAKLMFKSAIIINQRCPIAFHNLGNTFKHEKKYQYAVMCFKKALSLDNKFKPSFYALKGMNEI